MAKDDDDEDGATELELVTDDADTMRNPRLMRWLKRTVNKVPAVVSHLMLGHVTVSGKTEPLARFEVTPPLDEADMTKVSNLIDEAAYEDAEALGGHQRYKVQAIGRHGVALQYFNFRIDSNGTEDGEALSEPPTAAGQTTQAMRHSEVFAKYMIATSETSLSSLQRIMNRQAEMIEKLMRERMEMSLKLEELQSQRHERDLEIKRLEFQQKIQGEVFDQAKLLGPIVVNKMSGKKLLPEKQSAEQILVAEFCGSLTREQILERLIPALELEQRSLFLEVYEAQRNGKAYDPEKIRKFLSQIKPEQIESLQGVLFPTQQLALRQIAELCAKPYAGQVSKTATNGTNGHKGTAPAKPEADDEPSEAGAKE